MKRYLVQVNIGITAKNEQEAQRILKEIIESGRAAGSVGTKIAQVVLKIPPVVITELPF